jgi:hypothetical protein
VDDCFDEFVSFIFSKRKKKEFDFFYRDRAVAVSYPLKSSIWLTYKRAFYLCYGTIVILLLANLSFINLSGIHLSRLHGKYCTVNGNSIIIDLLTASILPIGKSIFVLSLLISSTSYYRKYLRRIR